MKMDDEEICISQIRYNGKNIFLGRFDTEEEAFKVVKHFEKENNIQNIYS